MYSIIVPNYYDQKFFLTQGFRKLPTQWLLVVKAVIGGGNKQVNAKVSASIHL
jgi:hypothetical protein